MQLSSLLLTNPRFKNLSPLLIVFTIGTLARALYSFEPYQYLNWDEAPQALMARQIAEGQILPVVHFQLPYIGAVEQYPLALAMLILGDDVATLRLFYFALSVISLSAIIAYYNRVLPFHWAILASLLFSLGPPIVLLLSLQSYSFGGLMAFSSLALLGSTYLKHPGITWKGLFAFGLLNGIALHNNILALGILAFSSWMVYLNRDTGKVSHFIAGFLLGYAPMLGFNLANDFISYKMLVAKFLGVTRYMVAEQGAFQAVVSGFVQKMTGHGPGGIDIAPLYAFPSIFSGASRPLQTIGLILLSVLVAVAYFTLLPRSRNSTPTPSSYTYHTRIVFYASTSLLFILSLSQIRYVTALLPFLPLVLCESIYFLLRRQKHLTFIITAFVLFYLGFAHIAACSQLLTGSNRVASHPILDALLEKS